MEIFGNYGVEELAEKGYAPTGKPGLLSGLSRIIVLDENRDCLTNAISLANDPSLDPKDALDYDGIVIYFREFSSMPVKGEIDIAKEAGDAHFTIVQPLKKIVGA